MGAAAEIVAAFGSHDKESYFSLFASDATFLFYTGEKRLNSLQEYKEEWESWEVDGFKIFSCSSSDPKVTLHADSRVAIFTHCVETDLKIGGERVRSKERETIVFEIVDGQWVAIHEHLSPDPNFS